MAASQYYSMLQKLQQNSKKEMAETKSKTTVNDNIADRLTRKTLFWDSFLERVVMLSTVMILPFPVLFIVSFFVNRLFKFIDYPQFVGVTALFIGGWFLFIGLVLVIDLLMVFATRSDKELGL
jgi:hypothetical protein